MVNVLKRSLWVVLPVALGLMMLGVGRFDVPLMTVFRILINEWIPLEVTWTEMERTVVLTIRLPRVMMAMMIGGGLAVAGAAFQGMFANPLVSSDILGVSAGAGFGASLGILLFGHGFTAQWVALLFGLLAIIFTYTIGGVKKGLPIFMLVLAGVVTNALFQALISLVKFLADTEDQLPSITYWLMGSLATISTRDMQLALPFIILGMVVLWLVRWRINVLTLSEEEARSLGISTKRLKTLVIVSATLITAASVAVSGIIGWVGLIIPHVARMLVGANNERVIPASIAIGSVYLLLVDTLARSLLATEIPLSILTALIGAPFFAYLLQRTGGAWR